MKKRIGLQGFLMFVAGIATVLFFNFLLPRYKNEALKEFLDALGIILVALGFLFRIAARGYKSDHSSEGIKLVRGGVYALIRNPMYLGTFLIGTGVILAIFSWQVGLVFSFIYLLIYIPQIKKEEGVLLTRFNEEYKCYCRTTPRFFPKPAILFKQGLRNYIFFKWRWVKKELPSLIAVTFLIVLTGIWGDVKLFGHAQYQKELSEFLWLIFCLFIIVVLFHEKENVAKKI